MSFVAISWLFFRVARSSRIDLDMLVARALKNSQLTPRPRGERHAYFGDRTLGFVLMWIRIRAVIIEDEPLAAQYLAALLDETCQVEVVGTATESETGLQLCAELRPDAVFLDIKLPGKDGVSLARQLAMLPQPPRLVFTTGDAKRATDAFRLEA